MAVRIPPISRYLSRRCPGFGREMIRRWSSVSRLQLDARSSDGTGDIFFWSPPEGLSDPAIANPIAVLGDGIDSIRYLVTATDSLGCVGSASIRVMVFKPLPDLFVPNAFTPGRAANGVFRPIPVGISRLNYFRVYNRNGQLVYSTSQMGEGWDGRVWGSAAAFRDVYLGCGGGDVYGENYKKGKVLLFLFGEGRARGARVLRAGRARVAWRLARVRDVGAGVATNGSDRGGVRRAGKGWRPGSVSRV